MSPSRRTFAAAGMISAWLAALLVGWAFGGAIHLLLLGALVAFPWRRALG